MPFGTNAANAIIDGLDGYYVSLHTADPGVTGANEVAGGSYTRQQVSLGAASNKAASNDAALNFAGMPAVTITHVGIWSLASGGVFQIGGALTASKTTNAGDTFQLPVGDLDIALT